MTNANDLFNILFDRNLREVTAHFLQGVKLDFSWGRPCHRSLAGLAPECQTHWISKLQSDSASRSWNSEIRGAEMSAGKT
jgi:hypothetical protein